MDIAELEAAIAALEAQGAVLGEAVAATALNALRAQLAALTAAPPPEQRRRATLLFADIIGFTGLSEQTDAEEVQALLTALWDQLDQIILAHGGVLDKHIGDAVLAVWGLEQAREDDAERAVRAALALQQALAAFRAAGEASLHMRVGLNTGLVSVATVASTGERNLIGDAVNLAARLQTAAPPDGILISQETCDAVRGLFSVTAQPPLHLKGRQTPVAAYLVHSVKPRAFDLRTRGLAGVATQMVGREAEFAALRAAYERAVGGAGLQWLTLIGNAGVGKSRLLQEFLAWLELRPEAVQLFKARAWPHAQHSPYFLLRDLFTTRFGITDSTPHEAARAKLTEGLSATLGAETDAEAAAFVGQLLGLDFRHSPWIAPIVEHTEQIYGRAAVLLRAYWRQVGVSAARPAVIVLEDLHWADRESLALLSTLFADLQTEPTDAALHLCVIGATRPELWEHDTPWARAARSHERLPLPPLSDAAAQQLVRELLQRLPAIPEWLSAMLVENAGGNPYFIEELVRWLIEQHVLRPGPEMWTLAEDRAVGLSVPGTVQGVLQARLEQLQPAERAVLQYGAVMGRAFWRGAVAYIGQAPIEEAVWPRLQQRELIFLQPTSQLQGEEEYHFRHTLLRDVVYEYTLKRHRRLYHRRAAEWLARAAERPDEWAAVIALHYVAAGEPSEAAQWYQRAGKQAETAYALQQARTCYQQALELYPHEAPYAAARAECSVSLARMLYELGEYAEVEQHYRRACEMAARLGDRPLQIRAWCGLSDLQARQGRLDEAQHSAAQAERLARAGDDPASLARALWQRGWVAYHYGDAETTLALAQEALALCRALALQRETADVWNAIGAAHWLRGQYDRAEEAFHEALQILQALGDRYRAASLLNNLGATTYMRGKYAAAAAAFRQAAQISMDVGAQRSRTLAQSNLGGALAGLGQHQEALDVLQTLVAQQQESGYEAPNTYRFIAQAHLGLGEIAAAEAAARHSLELAQRMGAQDMIGRAWRTLGEIAAAQDAPLDIGGQCYTPVDCFATSLDIFTAKGAEGERARTLLAWGRYMAAQGEPERGAALQAEGRAIFARLGIERE